MLSAGSEKHSLIHQLLQTGLQRMTDIAAAKAAPEYNYGAIGNNSDTEYPNGGTPDSESGCC